MPPSLVPGVSPDAPIETKSNGAQQSASPYRPELLPPLAVLSVSKILKDGADKYGAENWRGLTVSDNLSHALTHIFAYLAGDKSDDHIDHAACRLLFASELAQLSPKDEEPATSKPILFCKFCGNSFEASEAIHQHHGHNYHRACLPPLDFPR